MSDLLSELMYAMTFTDIAEQTTVSAVEVIKETVVAFEMSFVWLS